MQVGKNSKMPGILALSVHLPANEAIIDMEGTAYSEMQELDDE